MIQHRRCFLKSSAGALMAATLPRPRGDKPTLGYSIDLETFWNRSKFPERLKSLSESTYKTFEFGRFKAKDVLAINKLARELELNCSGFQVFDGLTDAKRKEAFLASFDDALEVAELLEVKRLVVAAGEFQTPRDTDRQIENVISALEGTTEKLKEQEITLLLDPLRRKGRSELQIAKTPMEAAEILEDVGSDRVKLLIDLEGPWSADSKFPEQIRAVKSRVGGFRLASSRMVKGVKSAGLTAAELLRLLHEVAPDAIMTYEAAAGMTPAAAIEVLQRADREASV